ncbi:MAG: prephenate dehydrogenase [bacterium]
MSDFRRIAIVGIGAIGGSFGLALKQVSYGAHIVGVDAAESLAQAKELGAIDEACPSLPEGISGADLIVLTGSTEEVEGLLSQVTAELPRGVIVSDFTPLKLKISNRVRSDEKRQFGYVGIHPLRRPLEKGIEEAFPDFFYGIPIFLTPAQRKDMEAFEKVKALFETLGARPVGMTPEAHDQFLAEIQQLPHLMTTAYLRLLFAKELAERPSRETLEEVLLAPMRSLVELPSDWPDEADANRENIAVALRSFAKHLESLAAEFAKGNAGVELEAAKDRALQVLSDQGFRAPIPGIRVSLPKGKESLSQIAEVLAKSNILVREVNQSESEKSRSVRIIFDSQSDAELAAKRLKGVGFRVWKLI